VLVLGRICAKKTKVSKKKKNALKRWFDGLFVAGVSFVAFVRAIDALRAWGLVDRSNFVISMLEKNLFLFFVFF
jgi:hypothetical protein